MDGDTHTIASAVLFSAIWAFWGKLELLAIVRVPSMARVER